MTGKQMIKLYEQNGWVTKRVAGSHYQMEKNGHYVSIAHHTREMKKRTLIKLLKIVEEVG